MKMKKNILIMEDSPKWLDKVCSLAASVNMEVEVFATTELQEAHHLALEYGIDLFIIDLILDTRVSDDTSGMDFADQIRQIDKYRYTPIIFISSLEDPKLYAYSNIHCYQYIEKPFDEDKTREIFEEALRMPLKKNREREYIYFRNNGILYGVRVDQIIYIQTNVVQMYIHTTHETVKLSPYSIKNILAKLDSDSFLQCSRNTIINENYIEYIDPSNRYVKLKNVDALIGIGPVLKKRFLQEIKNV